MQKAQISKGADCNLRGGGGSVTQARSAAAAAAAAALLAAAAGIGGRVDGRAAVTAPAPGKSHRTDRKSTRLNSSHPV